MIIRELVNKVSFKIDQAARRLAEKETQQTFKGMASFGSAIMGSLGTLAIGSFFRDAEARYTDLRQAQALTAQSLQNVGKQSGKTMADIARDAKEMTRGTLVTSTQFTRDIANNLLVFGGAHGAIFDRAAKDAIDLGQKMGSLSGAANALGMAMEHPEIGMMRLRRAQILFTKEQQDTIKQMVASNRVDEARAYILSVVESHVNGLAKAAYTGADAWTRQKKAADEAKISLGESLTPVSEKLANVVTKFTQWYTDSGKGVKELTLIVGGLGAAFAALGPVLFGLKQFIGPLAATLKFIAGVLRFIIPAAGIVGETAAGISGIGAGAVGGGLLGKYLWDHGFLNTTRKSKNIDHSHDYAWQSGPMLAKANAMTQHNTYNVTVNHSSNGPLTDAEAKRMAKAIDDRLTMHTRNAVSNFLQPAYPQ
jgi:hypothetical protein